LKDLLSLDPPFDRVGGVMGGSGGSELAGAGKGNRAIAQELFLSIKTVETHLAAGYRKLGVNTRAELADKLAG
jgi:Bacterial regulatory proteins, luxR family